MTVKTKDVLPGVGMVFKNRETEETVVVFFVDQREVRFARPGSGKEGNDSIAHFVETHDHVANDIADVDRPKTTDKK